MTSNVHADLRDQPEPLATPERVMTISAHPDDAEFGAGATLARWASRGSHITMLVVTDGSKGSWDQAEDQAALVALRKHEQQNAASVLGAASVIHLDYVDGELVNTPELRRRVAIEIRKAKPNVVLSHDPWKRYEMHPDHRATGWAATDGVVSAREPLALTDVGIPAHRPDALLLWSPDEADHAEFVQAEWFEKKIEALLCHTSQGKTTMGSAEAHGDAKAQFVSMVADWHERSGARLGIAPSEVFKRLTP